MKKIFMMIMALFMTVAISGCGGFGDDTPKFEGMYKYQYSTGGLTNIIKIEKNNNIYTVYKYDRLSDKGWTPKLLTSAPLDEKNLAIRGMGDSYFVYYDKKDKKLYYKLSDEKYELIPFTKENYEEFKNNNKITY